MGKPSIPAQSTTERVNRTAYALLSLWHSGKTDRAGVQHRRLIISLFSDAMQMKEGLTGTKAKQVLDGLVIDYAVARGLAIELLPIKDSSEERGLDKVEKVENATRILLGADRPMAKAAALRFLENRMVIARQRAMPEAAQNRLCEQYRATIEEIFDRRLSTGLSPLQHFVRLNRLWGEEGRPDDDLSLRHTRVLISVMSAVQERKTQVSIYNGDNLQTTKLVMDWALERSARVNFLAPHELFGHEEVKAKYAARLLVSSKRLASELAEACITRRKQIEESRLKYARARSEAIRKRLDELDSSYGAAAKMVLTADSVGSAPLKSDGSLHLGD
jgi:hypothetical protein